MRSPVKNLREGSRWTVLLCCVVSIVSFLERWRKWGLLFSTFEGDLLMIPLKNVTSCLRMILDFCIWKFCLPMARVSKQFSVSFTKFWYRYSSRRMIWVVITCYSRSCGIHSILLTCEQLRVQFLVSVCSHLHIWINGCRSHSARC